MNPMLVSYLASICFCLFLIIQSLIYYIFISRNPVLLRSRSDLPIIIIIASSIVLSDLMVFAGYIYPEKAGIVDKFSVVFGIIGLFFYVLFLRFISVSIKDSTFVETDGYKKKNRNFMVAFFILCSISIILIFFFYSNDSRGYFFIFQIFLIILLSGIGIIEQY